MNNPFTDAITLREILQYDALNERKLSVGMRITVHQFIGQRIELPAHVLEILKSIYPMVRNVSFRDLPEVRYNSDRVLESYSLTTGTWRPITEN